jgi:hypothetical protein
MRKKLFISITVLLLFALGKVNAQQQEMYTFCTGSTFAYLLDTSATASSQFYARWTISATAYSAHFLKDTIYQSTGSGSGGGSWGSVKKWICSSTIAATNVWTYAVSGGHHDICPLPNGNVLIIVHDSKTAADVTTAGSTHNGGIYSEKIQEIHQTGPTTGIVVWEWKLWDHICQSTNSAITSTYVSSVAANPQLMNVNYNVTSDWIHMNGIDYNPALDQIVMSSHFMNEIYIIDHSTTTAQAATHIGGNAGRGGDFLYRWGNPAAYGCATGGNGITLNTIHDARWVTANNPKYPNYISMYHNNGGGTVKAVLILPPHNGYNYTYTPGSILPPLTPTLPTIQSITGVQDQGSVNVCDNGNILITKPGTAFYECSGLGTTYQTVSVSTNQADRLKKCEVIGPFPTATSTASNACLNSSITLNASATSPLQASPTFTYSWSSSPSGFTSSSQNPSITHSSTGNYTYTVTVTSGGCSSTASVNITVNDCLGIDETSNDKVSLIVYPNPTSGKINLNEKFVLGNNFEAVVCNSFGEVMIVEKNISNIDLSRYSDGLYYLKVKAEDGKIFNKKIILIK